VFRQSGKRTPDQSLQSLSSIAGIISCSGKARKAAKNQQSRQQNMGGLPGYAICMCFPGTDRQQCHQLKGGAGGRPSCKLAFGDSKYQQDRAPRITTTTTTTNTCLDSQSTHLAADNPSIFKTRPISHWW